MPKIGFTDEMLETLKSLKGKTFKSYECLRDIYEERYTTFGNFRINLGRSSIEFSCYLERVEDYVGGADDIATFSCSVVDPKNAFRPFVVSTPKTYMVDEVIKGVELARDHVVTCNTENGDVCVVDIDIALVIRAKYHTFAFSIERDFSEGIAIFVGEPEAEALGITPLDVMWEGAEDLTVDASREFVRL